MDCDINASKYGCLGLSGYPASSFFFPKVKAIVTTVSLTTFGNIERPKM